MWDSWNELYERNGFIHKIIRNIQLELETMHDRTIGKWERGITLVLWSLLRGLWKDINEKDQERNEKSICNQLQQDIEAIPDSNAFNQRECFSYPVNN